MNKVPISPQLIDRLADRQTDRYKQRERQKNTYTQRYFYRQIDRKKRHTGIVNRISVYSAFSWRLFAFFFIFLGVKFE